MNKSMIFVVLLLIVIPLSYASAVPELINFQGKLRNSTGSALSGDYAVNFSIYDAASGGNILWSENVSVKANDGLFNVLLGSETPISLNFTDNYWLGVNVEEDGEMSPRQQISSVGYAFRAGSAENLSSSEDVHIQTDGINRLVVDSSGNAGIGTDTPSQNLDVRGLGNFSGTIYINNDTDISTFAGGMDYTNIAMLNETNTFTQNSTFQDSISTIRLFVNGAEIVSGANVSGGGNANYITKFIDDDTIGNSIMYEFGGKIGMGSIAPSAILDVYQTGSTNNYLNISNASNSWLYIGTNGRVGIGTATPSEVLDISPPAGDARIRIDAIENSANSSILFREVGANTNGFDIRYNSLDFYIDRLNSGVQANAFFIERTDGNIGINTIVPATKLEVAGTFNASDSTGAGISTDATGNVIVQLG